jgi:hypothetical protein
VISSPEHRLYEKLAEIGSDSAHSRYNALVRRLVSFESAAECGRGGGPAGWFEERTGRRGIGHGSPRPTLEEFLR